MFSNWLNIFILLSILSTFQFVKLYIIVASFYNFSGYATGCAASARTS